MDRHEVPGLNGEAGGLNGHATGLNGGAVGGVGGPGGGESAAGGATAAGAGASAAVLLLRRRLVRQPLWSALVFRRLACLDCGFPRANSR